MDLALVRGCRRADAVALAVGDSDRASCKYRDALSERSRTSETHTANVEAFSGHLLRSRVVRAQKETRSITQRSPAPPQCRPHIETLVTIGLLVALAVLAIRVAINVDHLDATAKRERAESFVWPAVGLGTLVIFSMMRRAARGFHRRFDRALWARCVVGC